MSDVLANIELAYEQTGERHLPACPFVIEYGWAAPASCTCPHVVGQWDSSNILQAENAALRSRITELEGERDYWHLAHEEAVEVWSCRAATAEARVESLERVVAQGTPLSVRWCVRWPHGMVVVEGDPLFPRCGACGPCRWDAALASLTTATTERAPTPTTPGTDESEMSVEGARSDISGP